MWPRKFNSVSSLQLPPFFEFYFIHSVINWFNWKFIGEYDWINEAKGTCRPRAHATFVWMIEIISSETVIKLEFPNIKLSDIDLDVFLSLEFSWLFLNQSLWRDAIYWRFKTFSMVKCVLKKESVLRHRNKSNRMFHFPYI